MAVGSSRDDDCPAGRLVIIKPSGRLCEWERERKRERDGRESELNLMSPLASQSPVVRGRPIEIFLFLFVCSVGKTGQNYGAIPSARLNDGERNRREK